MKRRISRRRSKRSSNETRRAPQSAPAPHSAQPITNGDPQAVLSEENIELMQRTYGNTATRQFVQREMENGAHGKGCGCGVCAGGRVQRSVDLFMRQAEATDSETHGKGCGCGACGGGQVQRIQRELMSYKDFKSSTKAAGRRNKINPIDEALKAYNKAEDSLSDEQKIQRLQAIVGLCQTYLDDPKRSGSKRRDGVTELQTRANERVKQLQPVVVAQATQPKAPSKPPPPIPTGASKSKPPNKPLPPVPQKAPDPATTAKGYYAQIITGKDPSTAKSVDRKDMLDLLQQHLTKQEFAKAAAHLMLTVPGSVVEKEESKERAIEILEAQLINKEVARRLIDKQTYVVIIPRGKKMTDVDEFKGLAGKKTFDGRNWEDVRGAGGFEHNGKVYVAVSEENTTGVSAEGAAAGTKWCYDPGYSTTVHEMAHAVEIYGIAPEDKKKSEDAYAAKKKLERDGTPQEWIDGYNITENLDLKKGQTAFGAVKTKLEGEMTTAKWTAPQQKTVLDAVENTMKKGDALNLGDVYQGWLKQWGILSHNKDMIKDAGGNVLYSLDSSLKPTAGKRTECYASSHVREYWAQGATAWFGANVGDDPYTASEWKKKKDPDKAKRRNGQAEVKRIDPVLGEIMERVFAKTTINDLNKPRANEGG